MKLLVDVVLEVVELEVEVEVEEVVDELNVDESVVDEDEVEDEDEEDEVEDVDPPLKGYPADAQAPTYTNIPISVHVHQKKPKKTKQESRRRRERRTKLKIPRILPDLLIARARPRTAPKQRANDRIARLDGRYRAVHALVEEAEVRFGAAASVRIRSAGTGL